MNNELIYQIALTRVPQIGDVHAKTLLNKYKNASDIFKAPKAHLEKIDGIGSIRANCIKKFNGFHSSEKEIEFMEKNGIKPIFLTSEDYPKRLLQCYDNPVLLYYKGNVNLNDYKIVSIAGTRNNSDYGKIICHKIIEELNKTGITIISGLAYGIDTIAHKSSLLNNIPTVAVLAHGLDRIYPPENKLLSREIIKNGGLLTEFGTGSNPDRQNFPKRNRIIAGICDALVIVESGKKGGSLITAELANGYNKDIFAVPGRINDPKSEGCNYLIKSNKAHIINSAADIIEMMGWDHPKNIQKEKQRKLFTECSNDEKVIVDILEIFGQTHFDNIFQKSKLSYSTMASCLLSLEMKNIIMTLPGKIYKLI